jgi:hypothetical protein
MFQWAPLKGQLFQISRTLQNRPYQHLKRKEHDYVKKICIGWSATRNTPLATHNEIIEADDI